MRPKSSTLYFSDRLEEEHLGVFGQIKTACQKFGQEIALLPQTNDIWVRDFMPIPLPDGTLLEYRYDPDYLQVPSREGRGSKSYPDLICDELKWPTKKTDLIIDGGNVIRRAHTLIMADKVVHENRHCFSRQKLTSELMKQFQVDKLVLIEWDAADDYGHADSMVRFIDDDTVLANYYYKDYGPVISPLKKAGLRIEFLALPGIGEDDDSYWPYLNFLQTEKLLLLPAVETKYDEMVLAQFQELFPAYRGKIAFISMPAIVADGGALNCISWTKTS